MATTNKALTTYLPDESVEWLERYCLDYKHLLNKEGNPKLGTALADIISRLADGELTLPPKIEPTSTVFDNAQYGTELETLKGDVEDLKKLFKEYVTSKLPDTVLDLEAVKNEIETALEIPAPVNTPTSPRKETPDGDEPKWVNTDNRRFYNKLVGNSELLAKVAEAIDLTTNNTVLADSLVVLGFHKQDGKPLGSDSISRIRKVVGYLRQAPESTLPLFPTND